MLEVKVHFMSSGYSEERGREGMKIGELAKRTGFNASAIRYYERLGLITAPHRTGGQRRYPDEDVYPVLLIRFASNMGFTLDEIKIFLGGLRDNAPVGPRWKKLAHRKIKEVEQTIKRSKQLKSLLQHLLQCHCASLQVCVERLSLSRGLMQISGSRAKRRTDAGGVESKVARLRRLSS
jgi:MerR family transcriptional regulator, redox-sensitive transcriptional activator SoxR